MRVLAALLLLSTGCAAVTTEALTAPTVGSQPQATSGPMPDDAPFVDSEAQGSSVGRTAQADEGIVVPGFDGPPVAPASMAAIVTATGIPVMVWGAVPQGLVVQTPCGRTATVSGEGQPLRSVDVVLDPGHGGPIDMGALGPNGLTEPELNLDVAMATRTVLESRGFTVALTRTADYGATLASRSTFADAVGAGALVSIHHNAPSANPSETPGTEVFIQSGSSESRRLGGLVWESVVEVLETYDNVWWVSAVDAGVLAVVGDDGLDVYGMIRRPEVPTALVELGYLSNPSEEQMMASARYVVDASVALADAIETFLESPQAEGSGHIDQPRVFNPERAPGTSECTDPPLEPNQ